MTEINPSVRKAFRYLNYLQVLFWRLGIGRWMSLWPEGLGTYMVITHFGRNSGRRYRTPVNFAMADGEIYCVAGYGSGSDWYKNMRVNPQVEIWHPDGWFVGLAEESPIKEETIPIVRQILINSGFVVKLLGLEPKRLTDEELMEECRGYKLIHLRRTAPRTGRTGPGDLVWLWPILLLAAICGKKRKKTNKK